LLLNKELRVHVLNRLLLLLLPFFSPVILNGPSTLCEVLHLYLVS
jgi:hypothetical protein